MKLKSIWICASIFLFSIVSMVALVTDAAVWQAQAEWSDQQETRYAAWVQTQFSYDIFTDPKSPYNGIKTDCADAVYAMRIIFSYENKLPFSMKDPSGGAKPISEKMARFDGVVDPNLRLRKFLRYVFEMGSTQTLPSDTYPIALTRDAVTPGSLILEKEGRHVYAIKELRETGVPTLIYSSLGNASHLIKHESWPMANWIFPSGASSPNGIVKFRWPQFLSQATQNTNYSREQYGLSLSSWVELVTAKLRRTTESLQQKITRQMNDLCADVQFRVHVVNESLNFIKEQGGGCLDQDMYDIYSTPSRDSRLKDMFLVLNVDEGILQGFCPVQYESGHVLDLAQVRRRSLSGLLSSNPHDSREFRWGESSGHSDLARRCK